MSASTELALPEITLQPVLIDRSIEDRGSVREEVDEEEGCHTPTSVESRLPTEPKSCPPAPKKPRRMIQCKRRLSELDLIVVGAEEIERLFCMSDRSHNLPPVIQVFKKQKRINDLFFGI